MLPPQHKQTKRQQDPKTLSNEPRNSIRADGMAIIRFTTPEEEFDATVMDTALNELADRWNPTGWRHPSQTNDQQAKCGMSPVILFIQYFFDCLLKCGLGGSVRS